MHCFAQAHSAEPQESVFQPVFERVQQIGCFLRLMLHCYLCASAVHYLRQVYSRWLYFPEAPRFERALCFRAEPQAVSVQARFAERYHHFRCPGSKAPTSPRLDLPPRAAD